MNSARMMPKLRGLNLKWLVITMSPLLFLWCLDCSFAAPIPLPDPSKPSKELIDSVSEKDVQEWMLKYKIIKPGDAINFTDMISVVQRRAGINVTGVLDFETKKLFVIPRCGNTEPEDEPSPYGGRSRRDKPDYIEKIRRIKKDQEFRILNYTSDLPKSIQDKILGKMMDQWATAIPQAVRIKRRRSLNPDEQVGVLVRFLKGNHSDSYPFDGNGGTVGHAVYPDPNTGFPTEVHFDDDETFTTGTSGGINLDWAALHEFGHNFGLEHSNVRESVMYPWYKGYIPNIELSNDDIHELQALYGRDSDLKDETRTLTTETTPTEASTTDVTTTEASATEATTTKASTTQATTTKASTTRTSTMEAATTDVITTETPTTDTIIAGVSTTKMSTTDVTTTETSATEATTTKASTTRTSTIVATTTDTITTEASTTDTTTTEVSTTKTSTTDATTTKTIDTEETTNEATTIDNLTTKATTIEDTTTETTTEDQTTEATAFTLSDPSNPSPEVINSVTDEDAIKWMLKYNIIKPGQNVNLTEKISVTQRKAGINVTGELDFETKKLFVVPRCGNTEPEDETSPYGGRSRRDKPDYIERIRRIKQALAFRILSYTSDLPKNVQDKILGKMMDQWAKAIPQAARMKRRRSFDPDEKVGVLVRFLKGNHSDSYPFDGNGGTIGHAVYPDPNTGFPSIVHFDDDETFTTGTSGGINLDWAALHEFGHILGLKHSNVRESVMYPWYKGYIPDIELSNDDIHELQALYGRGSDLKDETRTSTTETTPTEASTTDVTTAEASATEVTTTDTRTTEASTTDTTTTEVFTTKTSTNDVTTTETIDTEETTTEATTIDYLTTAAVTLIDPSNPSPEVINSVTDEDAIKWMLKYNIIKTGSNAGVNFTEKISVIQRKAGINVTGELDFETKKLLVTPRCGNTDDDDEEEPRPYEGRLRRAKRQLSSYVGGTCDQVQEYTFTIEQYTPDLPQGVQEQLLSMTLGQWFNAVPEATGCRGRRSSDPDKKEAKTISVSFVKRQHGDPFPFDGEGGAIGHVIFPRNNTRWFAEIHFDDDEKFTTGTRGGINLEWLALHEFGHSFGMKHSNVRAAVMYPWYKGYIKDIKLTNNDIQNLRELNAKPTTDPGTTTKTTPKVTTQPTTKKPTTSPPILNVCKIKKFDSFLMGTDGRTYVFSGDYFWVLFVGLEVESGPIKITSRWKELKTPINSAYANRDGRTVFFKGSEYWTYYGYKLEVGPSDISQYGLPSSLRDPDAAFVWGGNKKTYFFKGNNYWRYNESKGAIDDNYPKPISVWGLPHYMDSAMTWSGNKRTYFFKDNEYWRFDDGWFELEKGYPRSITAIWMKC